MKTRVLLVDDDPQVLHALRFGLLALDYELLTAECGATGLESAARLAPDLVVAELALRDMDGTALVTRLRNSSKAAILVLSARCEPTDVVAALDAGADSFMAKPFEPEVLMARLRALRRRAEPAPADEPSVLIGHFSIDLAAKQVTKRADAPQTAPQHLHLTKTEWAILEILVRNPGKLVEGKDLLRHVWGPSRTPGLGHLRFHLAKLRKKLEPEPSHPVQLITEPGVGYLFQP
jgi:two-component system, OmpR family, KDP operon response regulator KdpE